MILLNTKAILGSLLLLYCTVVNAGSEILQLMDEYKLYQEAGSRCGPDLDAAIRSGLDTWLKWSLNREDVRLWINSVNAFKYAYEKGCHDWLLVYRYGNTLRLLQQNKEAIRVLKSALTDLKKIIQKD